MDDEAPPTAAELEEALAAAAAAHHDYERSLPGGERDPMWPGFYAAFLLGRFGEFAPVGRLATLLSEVGAGDDWPAASAEHILRKLRN